MKAKLWVQGRGIEFREFASLEAALQYCSEYYWLSSLMEYNGRRYWDGRDVGPVE